MVCLDTSFVIDFLKNNKEAVEKEKGFEKSEFITITAPVLTELIRGLGTKHSSKEEEEKINEFINSLNVLNLDKKSAILAGKLEIESAKMGGQIGIMDIMVAAICISNNEVLLTKNKKHFARIKELKIESY